MSRIGCGRTFLRSLISRRPAPDPAPDFLLSPGSRAGAGEVWCHHRSCGGDPAVIRHDTRDTLGRGGAAIMSQVDSENKLFSMIYMDFSC